MQDEQPPVERKPQRSKRGNGEGSIYLRKDGRWTAAYFMPKPGGGESRRYVYGRSPEEVETKLVEIRKQVRAGTPLAPAGLTAARYLEEWMDRVAAPRVRLPEHAHGSWLPVTGEAWWVTPVHDCSPISPT